jgi:hypothetical protein
MPKKPQPRADNLRRAVAQEAARIMYEHGVQDFRFAKRKAAERFGATDEAVMPRNAEVEAALEEYQRLFGGEEHVESLLAQRLVAVDVMQVLREFQPRLVGPVLQGNATPHSDVQIHVFADRPETVTFRLIDRQIAYEVGEKRVRMNAERVLAQPSLEFEVDGQPVEVVVFPLDGIRQAPVSPVNGRPMRRAGLEEVETLVDAPA